MKTLSLLKFSMVGLIFLTTLNSCAATRPQSELDLAVVQHVDLKKYMGTWFEIATIPMYFQKDCTGTTATYSLNPDNSVKVVNKCYQQSLDGPLNEIEGTAWVVDPVIPAKLKVQFFWPFSGDYWIIELDKDYQYAVVGHPSRDYLWILSRQSKMDEKHYQHLLKRIQSKNYDLNRIVKTIQRKTS